MGSLGAAALIPSVIAATPTVDEPKAPPCPKPMKPSDLPIYEAPHAEYAEYVNKLKKQVSIYSKRWQSGTTIELYFL